MLEIDKEKGKISLGIKQKFTDPWSSIETKYPVGKRLIAKVVKIVSFGAFIELEEGVEGLLHISDLTWEGRPTSVEEYVAVGDKLWVQVIEINKEERKIKLGLKQLEMRPEEKYLEKHKRGEIVKAKVKKILKSRVFLGLEDGVEGVVKISDISYYHIESPEEFLNEGEEIDAMIISDELDRNSKVQLGIKHLAESEWRTFFCQEQAGQRHRGDGARKIIDGGITVEITRSIEGFIRIGDIDEEKITLQELEQKFKPGEKIEALISRIEARPQEGLSQPAGADQGPRAGRTPEIHEGRGRFGHDHRRPAAERAGQEKMTARRSAAEPEMKFLSAPWRWKFISGQPGDGEDCVFCRALQDDDRDSLVCFRGEKFFVLLNKYPYSSGHLMVAPRAHLASPELLAAADLRGDVGADRARPGHPEGKLPPRRLQYRHEHRQGGGRRRQGPFSPACRPALAGRRQFHGHGRRHQGAVL